MFCNEFRVLWQSMVDSELGGDVGSEARAHLEQCGSCARWAASMDALENALEGFGEVEHEAPAFLSTRIMANLEDDRPSLVESIRMLFAPRRLAAVAAVAVAFFAGTMVNDFASLGTAPKATIAARKVVLEYEAPANVEVGLVGDFNQWGAAKKPIASRRDDGRWVFELDLTPGRYQYAFVINGKKWLPDPSAAGIIPDGFGGMNSVIYVMGGEGDKAL